MSQMSVLHQFIRLETVRASDAARAAAVAIDEALDDMGAHVSPADAVSKAVHQLHRAIAHLEHAQGVRLAVSYDPDPFDGGLRVVA